MKLIKYRVRKFRSVQDSGWITLDHVNALIGENESGKTNLLLPLWKLKPSFGGEIDLISDAPRGEYTEVRETPDEDKPKFITAVFTLDPQEQSKVATVASCNANWVEEVEISRRFDGKYTITFPKAAPINTCAKAGVLDPLRGFLTSLTNLSPNKTDIKPKDALLEKLSESIEGIENGADKIGPQKLQSIIAAIDAFDMTRVSKTGGIIEIRRNCISALEGVLKTISATSPTYNVEARKKALALMPEFIYYSNYGNLDGQIYLPRAIEDIEKDGLTEKESAKARTLKVLFEYVKLDPREILDLGRDVAPENVNDESIQNKANEKRERTILLDSASTAMTKSFGDWWQQGQYVFKFVADGDHFKIWVSDAIRTDPIELENRSTGLQWFFSFFLVFLNERHDTHFGSILLLDEPGVTLHPMAQRDLFKFFEGISIDNQIVYTTHSPFLMDPDKLDQVKAVYVDENGYSSVSEDLRARANSGTESEQKAIFPVHSALGLSVSEVLFVGCRLMLVEGPSDQYYLNAIKNILIAKGKIRPSQELVFVPAGGARGIKSTSRVLAYDDNGYPSVLLDGDAAGLQAKQQLEDSLYQGREALIYVATDFIDIENGEVEDFVDSALVAKVVGREFRGQEDFEDIYDPTKALVPQVKKYCESEGIIPQKGWKVDVARAVKRKMLLPAYLENVSDELLERWLKLIQAWIDNDD